MTRLLITFFFLIVVQNVQSHDIKMAQFTIHVESNKLMCDGRIDKDDLQAVLGECFTEEDVEVYLRDHLSFKFNDREVSFGLILITHSKNWTSIRFGLETDNHIPKSVEVSNSILTADVEGQDNIMRFKLHDKSRTFRFNKERVNISFNY